MCPRLLEHPVFVEKIFNCIFVVSIEKMNKTNFTINCLPLKETFFQVGQSDSSIHSSNHCFPPSGMTN